MNRLGFPGQRRGRSKVKLSELVIAVSGGSDISPAGAYVSKYRLIQRTDAAAA